MSSTVARPIRISSKKFTSSKTVSFARLLPWLVCTCEAWSDFFHAARLAPAQVDAQLLRRPEDVVVALTHLDLHPVAGQHLDVQAQRLHLLDQHLERLRDTGLGDVLALDDRLVDLDATED